MAQGNISEKSALQTRKELGLAHLNADRIEEGLKIYAMILRDYPEDVESYIVIGDCYLAQGEVETASQLYAYALELSPGNQEIMRRLRLVKKEKGAQGEKSEIPVPELRAIGRVLQRIMGKTAAVTEQELERAVKILEEIRTSERPALAVAERLGEIEELIPALLELNVRQARAEGRPELALALDELLESVRSQLSSSSTEVNHSIPEKPVAAHSNIPKKANILFLVPSAHQISNRAIMAYRALLARGYNATLASTQTKLAQQKYDLAIAFKPHGDPQLMEFMAPVPAQKFPSSWILKTTLRKCPYHIRLSGFWTSLRRKEPYLSRLAHACPRHHNPRSRTSRET
jgi:tetratricopeptide (TPR) repeat protein